jgi:hypothetical protein
VIFEHLHYRTGKTPFDETYNQRDRFGDVHTFMSLIGARDWAAERLKAIINGEEEDPVDRLSHLKPGGGWFIHLSMDILRNGSAPLPWRFRLFSLLWLRFIYRKTKELLGVGH